jgi:hypothetical protein
MGGRRRRFLLTAPDAAAVKGFFIPFILKK